MNLKNKLTALFFATLTTSAFAQIDFKELSLNNGGAATNVKVIPINNETELGKFSLSYDVDKIVYGGEFNAAKHVIDRLSLPDQAKIYAFWNNALLEKKLIPHSISNGSVTLNNILKKSDLNTSQIETLEDYRVFNRGNYTKKLNEIIKVGFYDKTSGLLQFDVNNRSDFNLKKVYGNIRVLDLKTKRILLDVDIKESIRVPSGRMRILNVYQGSRLPNWANRKEDLMYSLVLTGVEFDNGTKLMVDEYYQELQHNKIVLNKYPFTSKF